MTRPAVPFVKMHGAGNDYVFLDAGLTGSGEAGGAGALPDALGPLDEFARRISDRHRGVGSDGLILLERGARAPVRMRMFNADGSEAGLCLNGLRCVALWARELLGFEVGREFTVETGAGDRRVVVERLLASPEEGGWVRVHAGAPDFSRGGLPAVGPGPELWEENFLLDERGVPGHGVNVGNPHLVLWFAGADEVANARLERWGPALETDSLFPQGVNVHAAAAPERGRLVMRTWERGSGITQACGSGAVAVFAVARRLERADPEAVIAMPGGDVEMTEEPGGELVMRGPAVSIFHGEWPAGG